ncbi:penicillin-binding protein 1A [Novosphingobium sp. Rr 2-17]|uniref:transglycosylase domain-containing protein n=1 Tax=Novosphingobium sp. Rr 2-17 TaxID=555793 RepID=UPI000269AB19|nr:transglycosylase domain-containing protein [Novosphingobium sp. Rr 2-17]EIZ80185.1 penicillin-binding protein 1A [Novosphingobium sp. Rr 2-17]
MATYATPPFDDDDDLGSGDPLALPREGASRLAPSYPATPSAPPPPPPGKRLWLGHRKRWWAVRIAGGLLAVLVLLIAWLLVTAPLSKSLKPISPPQVTLLAADGTPIARNGAIVAAPVQIAKLPKHVPQAFIAIEDRRFYTHWGIDYRGIARAMWVNLTSDKVQGGSTITQQLAKFTFLSSERSTIRKAHELVIAYWLEAWLTKDEILERYLSNAYFGDNTYGLRAASEHYFSREPERLTTAQAAMLAGMMKAPSRYAPTANYDLSIKRMRTVLGAMAAVGYITPSEAKGLSSPRLKVRRESELPTGTYFADWALPQARAVSEGGYASETYRTTLDSRLQAAARRAVEGAPLGKAQVALVAMRPNGEVVAMIGGTDYAGSTFNRVTQAKRQPGSTFKLFVYLAAMREGMRPSDTIDNTEITTGSYRPRNAGGNYSKTITLEDAFARSSNVAAVRLYQKVGDKEVIRAARDLGITAPLPEGDPSVPLGTSTMTLLELTSAYAGVAANRFPVEARAFPAEQQGWFDRILDRRKSLSEDEHKAMEELLRATINRGTGRAAMLNHPNFGKTGTTQDNRDALFVGYAGGLVVGVWVGNDDNTPLGKVHGGSVPATIWRNFMRQALGEAAAPPARKADPEGPVQPLDLPDIGDIPVGDGNELNVQDGQATFNTRIDGQPIGLKLGKDGLTLTGPDGKSSTVPITPSPEVRAQASQAARDAAAQARDRIGDAARRVEEEARKQGVN